MGFTPFQGDTSTLRGMNLTKNSTLKVLMGAVNSSTNCVSSLRDNTTNYVVPASKKFIFKSCFLVITTAATGVSRMSFGYGDNAVGYATGSSAPTNAVWMGGLSFTTGKIYQMTSTNTGIELALPAFEVPAGKYPHWEAVPDTGSPSAMVIVFGYEVAA